MASTVKNCGLWIADCPATVTLMGFGDVKAFGEQPVIMGASISDEVLDRAEGCLLGQAIGDALGTTVEFATAATIAHQYPQGLRELIGGGPFHLLPGQITDDTELALALARSLAEHGRYDEDAVARRYHAWYRSGPFDIGTTTQAAFGQPMPVGRNAAEEVRGRTSNSSQANGSLMRISPLGIFGWQLPPAGLAELAVRDSTLSHPHPACQESCVAFAYALALAIRAGSSPEQVYAETLAWMHDRPVARPAGVIGAIERAAEGPPADFQTHMGWVLIALQNAFYQMLHAESLEAGLIATVAQGGDTDTNGAIAGALLGAVHGARAIPPRWRDVLLACRTNRPADYQCGDLPALARRLVELGAAHANADQTS